MSVLPNLIKELKELEKIGGFRWFGHRKADYTKKCSCISSGGIASPSPSCSRCLSTGYLFTDYLVKGYMWLGILGVEIGSAVGKISTQNRNVVLQHNRPVNKFDFILELDSDPETGNPRQPFRIMRAFKVQDSMSLLGDDSRVEFWKCSVEERTGDDGRPGEVGTSYQYGGNRSNAEPS